LTESAFTGATSASSGRAALKRSPEHPAEDKPHPDDPDKGSTAQFATSFMTVSSTT